jgi:Arc/MetJ-type ribon-helix-helix transcriptional regulator
MPCAFPPDLRDLIGEQMASRNYASEDDLLRSALQALAEDEQDLIAIRQAVAEWESGDGGIPLQRAFAAIRAKHSSDAGS